MTSPPTAIAVAFLLAAALPLPLPARAAAPEDRTLSPYFVVEGGDPGVDALPLKATAATIDVVGVIADVKVEQTYANQGATPLHARYVFPASTRAAVHGMRMTVGGRTIEARIQERAEARATYERAKAEGKNASLLEQQRPNVFTMEVANVLPGDVVKVELRYTELLVPTDGVYELVYPTVVLPRYSGQAEARAPGADRWVESPYTKEGAAPSYTFDLRARIQGGIPLQDVTVPSHATTLQRAGPAEATIALDPAEKAGGDRDLVLRYRLAGARIESGLLVQDRPGEKFFLLMVEPPARVSPADLPPREYVFIVDVSGSMHGFPLDTAKELMGDLLGGLRPIDRFDVILFSGAHALLAPRSVPATPENVRAAQAFLDREQGGGGTELLPALREAMALPAAGGTARSFIVVTDGGISEEKAMFQYVRAHLGEANVFSFGIGSSVNRYLVEGLAKAGLGEAFVVERPAEAAAVAGRFRRYVEAPVLTDLQVSYDGFQASEVEPSAVPDLLARRPVVVQGKWTGPLQGTITVAGRTGTGPFRQVIDVATAKRARGEALRQLWARTRIAALSDFSARDESDEEKAEITRLGLAYGLLTRHTSFVAVLQEVRNAGGEGRDVDQPSPLPQGVSELAVGETAVGDEPGLLLLAGLAGAVAAIASLRRLRARAR